MHHNALWRRVWDSTCPLKRTLKMAYLLFSFFHDRDFPVWDKKFSNNMKKLCSRDHTVVLAARVWGLYGRQVQPLIHLCPD